jgi:Flp pilus assembly protein TadB
MVDVKEILRKYETRLEKEVKAPFTSDISKEYLKFKEEIAPQLGTYERLSKGIGKIIKIGVKEADKARISKSLEAAHLDVQPEDAAAFALFSFIGVIFLTIIIFTALYLIGISIDNLLIFLFLGFLAAIFVFYYTSSLPKRFEQRWRLKASSQMVPAILYTVVYMRHTPNLELAVRFAAEHLQPPLALDFKKVFWDVEIGKFSSIKESLDGYLETWREYSLEFVESFHLIESSLYEPTDARRVEILEKALSVILDGVYEKMLKYTHNINAPLTNLYMLGIVLPTLAIAMLPLASTLLGGVLKWWHVALIFNILVPFFVFYMTSQILIKRPGGYGEAELLEANPDYPYYKSKQHYVKAAFIAIPLFLMGIIPLIFQFTSLPEIFGLQKEYTFGQFGIGFLKDVKFFDFKSKGEGPFGLMALLLSLFIPLSIALFFAISYKSKTRRLLEMRDKTKNLETEFASSLFQLGNRLGDGIPAEMAFGRVSESLRGTPTAEFFSLVNSNIQQLGMSVKEAIFNPQRGAIIYFPSSLVKTSMQILIESVKKGLKVAANALTSISVYVKNIHKINERLRDLLADIISSMRSNMSFLAPMLAGIVVGLSAMISSILNKLSTMLLAGTVSGETEMGMGMSVGALTNMFKLEQMIPPYWLQIVVGIYLVEIIYILTVTLVSVESGSDKLGEKAEIAKNMKSGMLMYIAASLVAILALTLLAEIAVKTTIGG